MEPSAGLFSAGQLCYACGPGVCQKNDGVLADDILAEETKGLGELIRQYRAPSASARRKGTAELLEHLKGIS